MPWLTDWSKRIKCDIDYTNKIGASVTQFPARIKISASSGVNSKDLTCVFDEVGANKQKIAITKEDGETQLYAEIDYWDEVGELAEIHISKSDWIINADTFVYLYYDNTKDDNTDYIGITPNDAASNNVWDSSYVMVQHLEGATKTDLDDSTANNNDVTAENGTPDYNQGAKIGRGVNFVAASSEYVTAPSTTSLNPVSSDFTFECWFKTADSDTSRNMFSKGTAAPQYWPGRVNSTVDGGKGTIISYWRTDTNKQVYRWTNSANLDDNTWHYFAATLVFATPVLTLYVDGASDNDAAQTQVGVWGGTIAPTGVASISGLANNQFFNGLLDELRISKEIARSAAWIKASYNSGNDTLFSYGNEETPPTVRRRAAFFKFF